MRTKYEMGSWEMEPDESGPDLMRCKGMRFEYRPKEPEIGPDDQTTPEERGAYLDALDAYENNRGVWYVQEVYLELIEGSGLIQHVVLGRKRPRSLADEIGDLKRHGGK